LSETLAGRVAFLELGPLDVLAGSHAASSPLKRSTASKVEIGFRRALKDVRLERAFVAYSGDERYAQGDGIEAIGVRALALELATLDERRPA
jgi:hypothetical protein